MVLPSTMSSVSCSASIRYVFCLLWCFLPLCLLSLVMLPSTMHLELYLLSLVLLSLLSPHSTSLSTLCPSCLHLLPPLHPPLSSLYPLLLLLNLVLGRDTLNYLIELSVCCIELSVSFIERSVCCIELIEGAG